jgi:hypothetical protein
MIKHFQRFGLNVDDWPEANEDGSYPNGDEDNTEANEIDVLVTDEDVDDTGEPDDDDEMCEPC